MFQFSEYFKIFLRRVKFVKLKRIAIVSLALGNITTALHCDFNGVPEPGASLFEVGSRNVDPVALLNIYKEWRDHCHNAKTFYLAGKFEESEKEFLLAIETSKLFGIDDPRVASSKQNLAELYRMLQRWDECIVLYKDALDCIRRTLGVDHPACSVILFNLGDMYYSLGDYANAVDVLQEALNIRKGSSGLQHKDVEDTTFLLAESTFQLFLKTSSSELIPKFVELYKSSLELVQNRLPSFHPLVLLRRLSLAEALRGSNAEDEGFELLKSSHDSLVLTLKSDHPALDVAFEQLAEYSSKSKNSNHINYSIQIFMSLIDRVCNFNDNKFLDQRVMVIKKVKCSNLCIKQAMAFSQRNDPNLAFSEFEKANCLLIDVEAISGGSNDLFREVIVPVRLLFFEQWLKFLSCHSSYGDLLYAGPLACTKCLELALFSASNKAGVGCLRNFVTDTKSQIVLSTCQKLLNVNQSGSGLIASRPSYLLAKSCRSYIEKNYGIIGIPSEK